MVEFHLPRLIPTIEAPTHLNAPLKNVSNSQALATRDADSFYVQDCRQAQLFETAGWLETFGNQQLERIVSCIGL